MVCSKSAFRGNALGSEPRLHVLPPWPRRRFSPLASRDRRIPTLAPCFLCTVIFIFSFAVEQSDITDPETAWRARERRTENIYGHAVDKITANLHGRWLLLPNFHCLWAGAFYYSSRITPRVPVEVRCIENYERKTRRTSASHATITYIQPSFPDATNDGIHSRK